VTENSTEVRIPGFTLCTELQETILSFQNECTQIAAESSAPPDDSVHHTSIDDVQIIADPSIPEYPPCVVEEERPVPPPTTKKKTPAFVSILPRRRTRSTRSVEAAIGWQDVEQAIPILHPLSSMVDAGMVPHEPTVQVATVPQDPVMTYTVVTQEPVVQVDTVTPEPAAPQRIVPPELVIQEPTVHVETVPQEPVLTDTTVTQEPDRHYTRTTTCMLRMCHLPNCLPK
jgi:hypothetical protein